MIRFRDVFYVENPARFEGGLYRMHIVGFVVLSAVDGRTRFVPMICRCLTHTRVIETMIRHGKDDMSLAPHLHFDVLPMSLGPHFVLEGSRFWNEGHEAARDLVLPSLRA